MTTYLETLAEPRFRVVFGSRVLSIASETLRILALSVLVFTATGSPLLGAVAFGAGFLPQAVGGVLLGALPDRLPPRRLVAGGYALEATAAVVLAVGRLPVGWCLALVAAVACLTPVFTGASSRVVAEVLTGDAYVLGRSLMSMASSAAQLLGLAAGGVAVAALGSRHALLVAAAGNLVASLWARLGLPRDPAPRDRGTTPSLVRAGVHGSRTLLRDRAVRRLMLLQWLPPTAMTGAEALLVPYGAVRGFAPGVAGVLLAAAPVGMLAGDLVVGRFVRPAARERLVPALVVLVGAPLPVLLLRPPLAVVVLALVACGAGSAYGLGVQRPFLDVLPEAMRGQGFAVLSTGLMTLQGFGPVVSGALATWIGPAAAIATAGVAAAASAGLVLGGHGQPPRYSTAASSSHAAT